MMGLTPGAAAAAAAASSSSAPAAAAAAAAAFAKTAEDVASSPASAVQVQKARSEAFEKLQSCISEVVKDILTHSGITR